MDGAALRYHPNLTAERVRALPWRTQVGMVASELSRARHLSAAGGGPEVEGCLQRARELLGVLESSGSTPREAAQVLAGVAGELSLRRLADAPARSGEIYERLMSLYF